MQEALESLGLEVVLADVDDHEWESSNRETGQRREAIYFGVQGLIVKAGLGLGIGIICDGSKQRQEDKDRARNARQTVSAARARRRPAARCNDS